MENKLYYVVLAWFLTKRSGVNKSLCKLAENVIDFDNIFSSLGKITFVETIKETNVKNDFPMSCIVINDELKSLAKNEGINEEVLSSWVSAINKFANRRISVNGKQISISQDVTPKESVKLVKALLGSKSFVYNGEVIIKAKQGKDDVYLAVKDDKSRVVKPTIDIYKYYQNLEEYSKNQDEWTVVLHNGERFAVKDNAYLSLSEKYAGDKFDTKQGTTSVLLNDLIKLKNNPEYIQNQENFSFLKPISSKAKMQQEKDKFDSAMKGYSREDLIRGVSDNFTYLLEQKREQVINRLSQLLENGTISPSQKSQIEANIVKIRKNNIELLNHIGGINTIFKEIYDRFSKTQYELDHAAIKEQLNNPKQTEFKIVFAKEPNEWEKDNIPYLNNDAVATYTNKEEFRKVANTLSEQRRQTKAITESFNYLMSLCQSQIKLKTHIAFNINNYNEASEEDVVADENMEAQEESNTREGYQIDEATASRFAGLSSYIRQKLGSFPKWIRYADNIKLHKSGLYPELIDAKTAYQTLQSAMIGVTSPEEAVDALYIVSVRHPSFKHLVNALLDSYKAAKRDEFSDDSVFFNQFYYNFRADYVNIDGWTGGRDSGTAVAASRDKNRVDNIDNIVKGKKDTLDKNPKKFLEKNSQFYENYESELYDREDIELAAKVAIDFVNRFGNGYSVDKILEYFLISRSEIYGQNGAIRKEAYKAKRILMGRAKNYLATKDPGVLTGFKENDEDASKSNKTGKYNFFRIPNELNKVSEMLCPENPANKKRGKIWLYNTKMFKSTEQVVLSTEEYNRLKEEHQDDLFEFLNSEYNHNENIFVYQNEDGNQVICFGTPNISMVKPDMFDNEVVHEDDLVDGNYFYSDWLNNWINGEETKGGAFSVNYVVETKQEIYYDKKGNRISKEPQKYGEYSESDANSILTHSDLSTSKQLPNAWIVPIGADSSSCAKMTGYKEKIGKCVSYMSSYINYEIDRINRVDKHKSGVKYYNERGSKFCYLPILNSLKLDFTLHGENKEYTLSQILEEIDKYESDTAYDVNARDFVDVFKMPNKDSIIRMYVYAAMVEEYNKYIDYCQKNNIDTHGNEKFDFVRSEYTTFSEEEINEKFHNIKKDESGVGFVAEETELKSGYLFLYEAFNHMQATANMINLLTADPAFYKDDIDFQKRFKEIYAPKKQLNTESYYGRKVQRSIILKDPKVISNAVSEISECIANATNLSSVEKSAIIKSLGKIQLADGQALASFSAMRSIMDMAGNWDSQLKGVTERLRSGNWNFEDLNTMIQIIKPYLYDCSVQDMNGVTMSVPFQAKMSLFPIMSVMTMIPGVISQSPHLAALNQFMESQCIDVAYFDTAIKVGANNVVAQPKVDNNDSFEKKVSAIVKHYEKETGLLHKDRTDYTPQEVRDNANKSEFQSKAIQTHDYSSFGIQMETPAHLNGHVQLVGTQIRKHIRSDMPKDTIINIKRPVTNAEWLSQKPKDDSISDEEWLKQKPNYKYMTAEEWLNHYNMINTANIMESFANLSEDFNDIEKIAQIIRDRIKDDDRFGESVLKALDVVTDDNGNKMFNVALIEPANIEAFQHIINSIIRKKIQNQKIKGGSAIQVSCYGLDELSLVFEYEDINGNTVEINKSGIKTNLEAQYNRVVTDKEVSDYINQMLQDGSNNLRLKCMECYLPVYDDNMLKWLHETQGEKDVYDIDSLPEELRNLIGYRIPTEDKYSIAPLRIKGFLPQINGTSIMLPADITLISGSDFDVDKMYLMLPEFKLKRRNTFNNELMFRRIEQNSEWEKDFSALVFDVKRSGNFEDYFRRKRANIIENASKEGIQLSEEEIQDKMDNEAMNLTLHLIRIGDNAVADSKAMHEISEYMHDHEWGFTHELVYDKFDYEKDASKQNRAARNNGMIELMYGALTSPYMTDKILNPGNFDELKRLSRIITILESPKAVDILKRLKIEHKKIYDLSFEEADVIMKEVAADMPALVNPATYLYYYKQNMGGKKMTGIFAYQAAGHAQLQMLNIAGPLITMTTYKDKYGNNVQRKSNEQFDAIYAIPRRDGTVMYISKNTGSLVPAATDTAKDPTLVACHFDEFTSTFLCALIRSGFAIEDAAYICSQPIIKVLINKYNEEKANKPDGRVFSSTVVNKLVKEFDALLENVDVQYDDKNKHEFYISLDQQIEDIAVYQNVTSIESLVETGKADFIARQRKVLGFFQYVNNIGSAINKVTSEFRTDKGIEPWIADIYKIERRAESGSTLQTLDNKSLSVFFVDNEDIRSQMSEVMYETTGYAVIAKENGKTRYNTLHHLESLDGIPEENRSNFEIYDLSNKQERLNMLTSIMSHTIDPVFTSFYYSAIQGAEHIYSKIMPFFRPRYRKLLDTYQKLTGLRMTDENLLTRFFRDSIIYQLTNCPEIKDRKAELLGFAPNDLWELFNSKRGETERPIDGIMAYDPETEKSKTDFVSRFEFNKFASISELGKEAISSQWLNFLYRNPQAAKDLYLHAILRNGASWQNGYGQFCPTEVKNAITGYVDLLREITDCTNEFDEIEFIVQFIRNQIRSYNNFTSEFNKVYGKNDKEHFTYENRTVHFSISEIQQSGFDSKAIAIVQDDDLGECVSVKPIVRAEKEMPILSWFKGYATPKRSDLYYALSKDLMRLAVEYNCKIPMTVIQSYDGVTYEEISKLGFSTHTVEYEIGMDYTMPSVYDLPIDVFGYEDNNGLHKGRIEISKSPHEIIRMWKSLHPLARRSSNVYKHRDKVREAFREVEGVEYTDEVLYNMPYERTEISDEEKSEKAELNKEISKIVDELLSDDMTTDGVKKYFADYKNKNGEELYNVLKYNVPAKTLTAIRNKRNGRTNEAWCFGRCYPALDPLLE